MRQEKSRKEAILQELDSQLAHLLLIRKSTNEVEPFLMRSLADQFLYCEQRYEQMLRISLDYFEECLISRNLPPRLSYFYDSEEHVETFRQQPELPHYDKVHLELLSQKHRCRICVYSLTPDFYLSELVVNNNHPRSTQLSKVLNHYDPVYTQESLELANEFKDMIVEKLQQWSNKDQQPLHVELKPPTKRKHKKSLSVCDESQYKEFEYIFNHPAEVKVKNLQPKKQQLDCEDDDYKLIKECCERKGSTSLEKQQLSSTKSLHGELPFMPTAFPFVPMLRQYSADYRLIQSQRNFSTHSISPSKVEDPNRRYTGRLKFFDELKNYGFIVMDEDCSDIFVHYDDLEKANIDKDFMRSTKHGHIIRFEFTCMEYIGKYNRSRKAVNLVLLTSGFLPF